MVHPVVGSNKPNEEGELSREERRSGRGKVSKGKISVLYGFNK